MRLGIDHDISGNHVEPNLVEGSDHKAAITMFHGTSSEFMDSIKKYGLVLGRPGGGDDWLKTHGGAGVLFDNPRKPSVFLSSDKAFAEHFAKMMKSEHPGFTPVVFQVNVPVSRLQDFKPDELATGAVRTERSIPKEWIVGVVKEETEPMFCVVMVDGGKKTTKSEDEPRDQDGKWTSASGSFLPVVQGTGKDKHFYVQHGPTKTWLGSTLMFKHKANAEAFVEKHLDPKNEWWRDAPNLMSNVYSKAVDEFHKLPAASKKNPLVKDDAPVGMLTRLFKGKSAGAPLYSMARCRRNGKQGPMEPPGPDNTDPEFSNTTNASLAHDATTRDQTSEKMTRFVSAMSPSASRYGQ